MLDGKAKALAARNSAEDAQAALLLRAAGYRVQDGMGIDVLLWRNGEKVAYATPHLADGQWAAQKLSGCLLFGVSSQMVVAKTPCVAFLQLLGMEPEPTDPTCPVPARAT